MMKETEKILLVPLEFLPLKTNAYIVEGNALRVDWESVVSKGNLHYIMGNPAVYWLFFAEQGTKSDILSIYVDEKGKPYKTAGKLTMWQGGTIRLPN